MEGSPSSAASSSAASSSSTSASPSLAATSSAGTQLTGDALRQTLSGASPALATSLAPSTSVSPTLGYGCPSPFPVAVGTEYPVHPPLLPLQPTPGFPHQNSPFPFHPSPSTPTGMVDNVAFDPLVSSMGKTEYMDHGPHHQGPLPSAVSSTLGASTARVQDDAVAVAVTPESDSTVPSTPPQTSPRTPTRTSPPSPPQSESMDVYEAPTLPVSKTKGRGGGRGGGRDGAGKEGGRGKSVSWREQIDDSVKQDLAARKFTPTSSSPVAAQAAVKAAANQAAQDPPYSQPFQPAGTNYPFRFAEPVALTMLSQGGTLISCLYQLQQHVKAGTDVNDLALRSFLSDTYGVMKLFLQNFVDGCMEDFLQYPVPWYYE